MKKNPKMNRKRRLKRLLPLLLTLLTLAFVIGATVITAGASVSIDFGSGEADAGSSVLDTLFLLVFIALIPTFLLMMTCFTRIIISLSFLRSALGTQSTPPNQVLVGIAVFLSLFIMMPTINQIDEAAYQPYKNGEATAQEAISLAAPPLKTFMLKQVYEEDLDLFMSIADKNGAIEAENYDSQEKLVELSYLVIIPSFMTSEIKRGFLIGFLLYIPFLIIDLVVASTLMSMGMVMLPPATIALPFKLMMFVLVDGWGLLFSSLIAGFR